MKHLLSNVDCSFRIRRFTSHKGDGSSNMSWVNIYSNVPSRCYSWHSFEKPDATFNSCSETIAYFSLIKRIILLKVVSQLIYTFRETLINYVCAPDI